MINNLHGKISSSEFYEDLSYQDDDSLYGKNLLDSDEFSEDLSFPPQESPTQLPFTQRDSEHHSDLTFGLLPHEDNAFQPQEAATPAAQAPIIKSASKAKKWAIVFLAALAFGGTLLTPGLLTHFNIISLDGTLYIYAGMGALVSLATTIMAYRSRQEKMRRHILLHPQRAECDRELQKIRAKTFRQEQPYNKKLDQLVFGILGGFALFLTITSLASFGYIRWSITSSIFAGASVAASATYLFFKNREKKSEEIAIQLDGQPLLEALNEKEYFVYSYPVNGKEHLFLTSNEEGRILNSFGRLNYFDGGIVNKENIEKIKAMQSELNAAGYLQRVDSDLTLTYYNQSLSEYCQKGQSLLYQYDGKIYLFYKQGASIFTLLFDDANLDNLQRAEEYAKAHHLPLIPLAETYKKISTPTSHLIEGEKMEDFLLSNQYYLFSHNNRLCLFYYQFHNGERCKPTTLDFGSDEDAANYLSREQFARQLEKSKPSPPVRYKEETPQEVLGTLSVGETRTFPITGKITVGGHALNTLFPLDATHVYMVIDNDHPQENLIVYKDNRKNRISLINSGQSQERLEERLRFFHAGYKKYSFEEHVNERVDDNYYWETNPDDFLSEIPVDVIRKCHVTEKERIEGRRLDALFTPDSKNVYISLKGRPYIIYTQEETDILYVRNCGTNRNKQMILKEEFGGYKKVSLSLLNQTQPVSTSELLTLSKGQMERVDLSTNLRVEGRKLSTLFPPDSEKIFFSLRDSPLVLFKRDDSDYVYIFNCGTVREKNRFIHQTLKGYKKISPRESMLASH